MTVEEALVTVEAVLGQAPINDLQELIFRSAWEQKSYIEIAEASGYDADYIKYVGFQLWQKLSNALGEKITKNNFRAALRRKAKSIQISAILLDTTEINTSKQISAIATQQPIQNYTDWGEAIDVSVFYGRSTELATLKQWIIQEQCRLVAILGIGGTGKTALSVKLVEQIPGKFEYVIWRSLHNAPAIDSLLTSLIQFISNYQETDLSEDTSSKIIKLCNYLQKYRCLLILDNIETILASADASAALSGCKAGHYREGYEIYGELFKRVGEVRHNSCLILTSREKPKEIAALAGKTFPVRSLQLSGLTTTDGLEILKAKGLSFGSASDWHRLVQSYAGNPLALKIVATTINDLFAGNITDFLAQGAVIFGDIQDLLNQQFSRLSSLEIEMIYWLAVNREPVSLTELQADILSPLTTAQLLEALESLERRSLLEKSAASFTLQPVLMEYLTNRLITQICEEIITETVSLYKSHALLKAQAKDYVQAIQVQLILKPVIKQLFRVFGNPEALDYQLMQILAPLRKKLPKETGYAAGNTLNLLRQLQINLQGHDFSQLTVWQADLRNANLQGVNFFAADLAKSSFTEDIGYIFAMAASPDGRLLATADSSCKISLWLIAEGKQILNWYAHTGWARAITFSLDGKSLISGSDDHTVKVWDINTGQCCQSLQGHTGWIIYIGFSPDGLLASASEDQTIKLWDTNTGQCLKTLQGHTGWVCYVAFSRDRKTLASGSADQTIKLWDTNTGQCLKTLQGHKQSVGFVTFSADSKTVISASEDQTIKVWNVESGQCLKTLSGVQKGWIWWSSVSLSSDYKTLAIGSTDLTIKLWDISTGQLIKTLQSSSGIRSITFSGDDQTLISSHEDQTLKLWNVTDGKCLKTFQGYSSGVWAIAFNSQGNTLVSGGADQMLKVWSVADGKCLKIFRGHTDMVRSVVFNPEGNILASSGADQTIKLWDISAGRCLKTFRGHTNWVLSVVYSPDGQTLASGSLDQTIRIWDVHEGKCLRVLSAHTSLVLGVAYSPDGQTLASGGGDKVIRLWDVTSGECTKVLQGHTNWVWPITFSPDRQTLASAGIDQTIKIWDLRDGKCLRTLSGHNNWIHTVAYSPDSQTLASGSMDHTVRLWDVNTGECLKVLQGHTGWILAVVFTYLGDRTTPNSKLVLASGSDDQTIRFWDIQTGECLKILRSERPYEGMNITSTTGLNAAQKATLKALGAIEEVKQER